MDRFRTAIACLLALTARTGNAAAADTKVACVGDSITAGSGASTTNSAYPGQLSSILGAGWDVRNFGNSGKTAIKAPSDGASYWSTTQFTQSQSFQPNIVVIMLGTNDSKTDNWKSGNNTYAEDYAALVKVYTGLASKPKVYAMLPIPALSSQYNISASAIQSGVIPAIKQVAAQAAIDVIDLNTPFAANQPASMLGDDSIHPNDKGYRFIAQIVANVLDGSAAGGSSGTAGAGGAGIAGAGVGGAGIGATGGAPSSSVAGGAGAGASPGNVAGAGATPGAAGSGGGITAGLGGAESGGAGASSASAGAPSGPSLPVGGSASTSSPTTSDHSGGCRLAGAPTSNAMGWTLAQLGALTLLCKARRKGKRERAFSSLKLADREKESADRT